MTRTPLSKSKGQRSRSPDRFGRLFKSLHNLYGRQHILRHRPERAAACRPWGGGILWRPPAQLVYARWAHVCPQIILKSSDGIWQYKSSLDVTSDHFMVLWAIRAMFEIIALDSYLMLKWPFRISIENTRLPLLLTALSPAASKIYEDISQFLRIFLLRVFRPNAPLRGYPLPLELRDVRTAKKN